MKLIKTGIRGLDELLDGGIPENHQIFVCGGPGTGKTTLGIEFLYRGAKEGDKGVFVAMEEGPEYVMSTMQSVFTEWGDLKSFFDNKKIIMMGQESYVHLEKAVSPGTGATKRYVYANLLSDIIGAVEEHGAKRVVIDSSTVIKLFFPDPLQFRRSLLGTLRRLKKLGCTTIITSEFPTLERESLMFEAEHFVADGLIMLYNIRQQEKRLPALEILKMRGIRHSKALTPFKITPRGITVYVGEKVY